MQHREQSVPVIDPANGRDHNLYFMHINKTAGMSVMRWFRECGYPPISEGHTIVEDFDPAIFYFTIVRNPYDRLASCFFQMNGKGAGDGIPFLKPGVELNDFISTLGKDPRGVRELFEPRQLRHYDPGWMPYDGFQMTQPCSYWIKDLSRFKIFKFEELHCIQEFFQNHGFKFSKNLKDVKEERSTTKQLSSYKHLYTKDNIKIIQKLCEDDFRFFGYEE